MGAVERRTLYVSRTVRGSPWRMSHPRIGGWRVEPGLVRLAGADGLGHRVVDFEDDAFGAVVAVVLGFVLAADDREGGHNA